MSEKRYCLPVTVIAHADLTRAPQNQVCLVKMSDGQIIDTWAGNLEEVVVPEVKMLEPAENRAITESENRAIVPPVTKTTLKAKKAK